MKLKSKVELHGTKKRGYVIIISDNNGYKEDFSLTEEEIIMLYELLKEKLFKN